MLTTSCMGTPLVQLHLNLGTTQVPKCINMASMWGLCTELQIKASGSDMIATHAAFHLIA